MRPPRLRGGSGLPAGPWPVGLTPDEVVFRIAKQIVYRLAVGAQDISGDDYGDCLAAGVEGKHEARPLGIVDVTKDKCAWSAKTVKNSGQLHDLKNVRLISGRNSPDYSLSISDPRKDVAKTGNAVLAVWNERVSESHRKYEDIRLMVLVRNMETKQFMLFEEEIARYSEGDYEWRVNKRGNFEGIEKSSSRHCFTWQPHGAQFTILHPVPGSACCFSIKRTIPMIQPEIILKHIKYEDDWINIER